MGTKKKKKPVDAMVPVIQKQPNDDDKPFGFLDLSAELRNTIYELCLTTPEHIIVTKYPTIPRKNRDAHRWYAEHVPTAYPRRSRHKVGLSANLLVVCKAIHEEANPMLYGSNRFDIRSIDRPSVPTANASAVDWTKSIGSSVQHLRNVILLGARRQQMIIGVLDNLKRAESLQTLTIDFSTNFRSPKTMAKALYPLVLSLHISRKNSDEKPALDVLCLQELGQEFAEEVRGALERRLGC